MNNNYEFTSERLGFRLWKKEDALPFSSMNHDPEVMRYFPKTLSEEESQGMIERITAHFEQYHYGLWAVELLETGEFIGFIGFNNPTFEADFTPCVEIGWRLDKHYWNHGYATEGAKRCLRYAYETLGLDEIYSFTAVVNEPSRHVMEKIDLQYKGEFMHPNVQEGNWLKPHVLYGIDRVAYETMKRGQE